jgi:cytochrome c-L
MRFALVLAGLTLAALATSAGAEAITFRYIIDNSPLDVTPKPGEVETEAVKQFKQTGVNPYKGNAEATAAGKKIYDDICANCHMPDGSGRMGPSLIEDYHIHEEIKEDLGLFSIIYAGGAGAMQPFSKRMSQDDILKVMTYVRTLMKP